MKWEGESDSITTSECKLGSSRVGSGGHNGLENGGGCCAHGVDTLNDIHKAHDAEHNDLDNILCVDADEFRTRSGRECENHFKPTSPRTCDRGSRESGHGSSSSATKPRPESQLETSLASISTSSPTNMGLIRGMWLQGIQSRWGVFHLVCIARNVTRRCVGTCGTKHRNMTVSRSHCVHVTGDSSDHRGWLRSRPDPCHKHGRERKLYCDDCKLACCVGCLKDHSSHRFRTVDSVADVLRKVLDCHVMVLELILGWIHDNMDGIRGILRQPCGNQQEAKLRCTYAHLVNMGLVVTQLSSYARVIVGFGDSFDILECGGGVCSSIRCGQTELSVFRFETILFHGVQSRGINRAPRDQSSQPNWWEFSIHK